MATKAEAELAVAYSQLSARIRGLIATAKDRGTSTRYLEPQLQAVDRALKRASAAEAPFQSEVANLYARSANTAAKSLLSGGLAQVVTAFTGVDERALAAIQGRVSSRLSEVRQALTLGLGLGDRRLAGKEIEKALRGDSEFLGVMPDGSAGIRVPSGRLWAPDVYSKMLARTAMADSRRVAFRARYVQNGIDVVRIVPNGTVHDVCARWEGELLSLTGETDGLPTLADAEADGMFHPNCAHRYVVDLPSALAEAVPLAEGEEPEPDEARPILGIAPEPRAPAGSRAPGFGRAPAAARGAAEPAVALGALDPETRYTDPELAPAKGTGGFEDVSEFGKLLASLPANQRAAIDGYTGSDFYGIRDALTPGSRHFERFREDAKTQGQIRALDELLASRPLERAIEVYRGVRIHDREHAAAFGNLKVGATFTEPSFSSWTGDKDTARNFSAGAASPSEGGVSAVFRVVRQKGEQALVTRSGESEVLLPRGLRFRILRVHEGQWVYKRHQAGIYGDTPNRTVVDVEVIG